jgi:endonuclease/exonuclease/phosphatase family metal-dependent hydrolase
MRLYSPLRLFQFFSLTTLLVAACGSSSPAGPSAAAAAAAPEFRVMTFNIQHGLNNAGKYDLKWAIDTIAKLNPDLVGVQELTRNHAAYNCDDQPAKIAEGLSAATGRQWRAYYQQEWFTQNRACQNSGRGDGVETEGLGFFAPEPVGAPTHTGLWNGRIGLMTTLNAGREVAVIVTHLAHNQSNQPDRMRQLDALLPWSVSQRPGSPRIFMGDFNLWPDSAEYTRIRAHFRDAWEDGLAAGRARGRMDGVTHKSVRIDYIFYSGDALELRSIENVQTAPLIGLEASDHNPLLATFAVK